MDFSIETTEEDIIHERIILSEELANQGISLQSFSDGCIESLAVYRKLVRAMLDYDTLLFHGSAVAVDGLAYIFTAASGVGKSTHRSLWQELYGDAVIVVNDDKPLIRLAEGETPTVCGTPWNGKHGLDTNIEVPIKAICLIEQGESNVIEHIKFGEALPRLLEQINRPDDVDLMIRTLDMLGRLADSVEFYKLACTRDIDAARVAYEGMR